MSTSQAISRDVLIDSYAQPGETTIDDVRLRIADALATVEPAAVRDAGRSCGLEVQRAGSIPAARIAAHAGTGVASGVSNCFVQPIGDSIADAQGDCPSIYEALRQTAETLRLGGGVGLDFSPIRPHGASVGIGITRAAGPLDFIRLFETSSGVLEKMTSRRSAQMAVLRCDHPDIEAFVDAKRPGGLSRFNLSVAVTDEFMRAVQTSGDVELVHPAEPGAEQKAAGATRRADGKWVYRRLPASVLWAHIVRAAYENGEPGLLFLDRVNADNNLGYCETIHATNPCGEQPLPAYGACCLGSFDLTQLVRAPFESKPRFAFDELARLVPVAVRMLDNVIDCTGWPWPQQRDQAFAKRRIGLGFTGLGDALIMMGLHYGSDAARQTASAIARCLRDHAYAASIALAAERGSFPAFDAAGLLRDGSFASRLPASLQSEIRRCGLRNSHLLSIAPAGSVSLAFADNASSGIEPAYAWNYLRHRRRRTSPDVVAYVVEDHAWREFQRLHGPAAELTPAFVTALDLSCEDHLAMVAAVAPCIDGAISKTVNAPKGCSYGEFDALYRNAWTAGLKGITAFRPGGVLGSVLHVPASPI